MPRSDLSSQNRPKIEPESNQNWSKIDLGGSGRPRIDSGAPQKARETHPEQPRTRSGRPNGALGTTQGAPRQPKNTPGALPGRPRGDPRRSLNAFALLNAFRDPHRAIFNRFGFDAQQLRSAFRTGFYDVFSMLDVLRIERSWHAKTSKKQAFRARKSRPGASRRGPDEQVRAAKRPSRATKRAQSSQIEPIEGRSSRPGRARSLGCSPKSSAPPRIVSLVGEFRY